MNSAASADPEGPAAAPAGDPPAGALEPPVPETLVWHTQRMPYLIGFVAYYLILSALLYLAMDVRESVWLLTLVGPFLAAPAWRWLGIFLSGPQYRLTADRLDLVVYDHVHGIPLWEMVVLQTSSTPQGRKPVSITLTTRRERRVIPRYIDLPAEKIVKALLERIRQQQECLRRPKAKVPPEYLEALGIAEESMGDPWPACPDLPKELRDLYAELEAKGQAGEAVLFRGPVYKRAGWVVGGLRPYAVWMAVLGVVGAALLGAMNPRQTDPVIVGIVFAAIGLVVAGLTFLPHYLGGRRKEWLLLHPEGMAMMGVHLTGELEWRKVLQIHPIPSWRSIGAREGHPSSPTGDLFFIETADEAKIAVVDQYDAPLPLIHEYCRRFRTRALGGNRPAPSPAHAP